MKTFDIEIRLGSKVLEAFTLESRSGKKALEQARENFVKDNPFVYPVTISVIERGGTS
jgi:hypothetical protein